jgi:hypothetical protein
MNVPAKLPDGFAQMKKAGSCRPHTRGGCESVFLLAPEILALDFQ